MINIYFVLLGYFLIFFSLILTWYRLKNVQLDKEDYLHLKEIDRFFNNLKNKILRFLKISEKEIIFLWYNFVEKILRRIKIEALKIESWANKKLENLKNKNLPA